MKKYTSTHEHIHYDASSTRGQEAAFQLSTIKKLEYFDSLNDYVMQDDGDGGAHPSPRVLNDEIFTRGLRPALPFLYLFFRIRQL